MVSPHGYIWLKNLLSISLVTSIFNIIFCTRFTGALASVFFVIKTGLISKSFIKGVRSRLNLDPLSNSTWRGCGYLHIHVLLNRWITLADDLYIYSSLTVVSSSRLKVSISKITNQPVAGSIIVLQVRPTLFIMIAPPVCCCLIELIYDLSSSHEPNIVVLVLPSS